ncbi:MAG TPA: VWA domain-containing protein [Candidatus Aquilonibacter sp.]|nr:VWA domain-containing protein [Candidatus Aquilonibacter sp.]
MSFDHPLYLIPAVLAALFAGALLLGAEQRMTARDLMYSDIDVFIDSVRPRLWIARLFRALWIAALACGALAIAGPHLAVPLPARDGAVFICIDTSGSMNSTDVEPTRAAAAKAAAAAFIDAAPAGIKVGIIAFASGSAVVAPLSRDHAAVKAALADIPSPNGATAIGDALALAEQHLGSTGHRVIVLITDGVNNAGTDPQAVAQQLGSQHVPVYTIGIGTPNGDIIGGEQSTIDEGALRDYADASGGAYARVESATQLRNALAHLGTVTMLERQDVPLSLPLALAAAGLLAITLFAGLSTGRVP